MYDLSQLYHDIKPLIHHTLVPRSTDLLKVNIRSNIEAYTSQVKAVVISIAMMALLHG
jgi:hypothetical protein